MADYICGSEASCTSINQMFLHRQTSGGPDALPPPHSRDPTAFSPPFYDVTALSEQR